MGFSFSPAPRRNTPYTMLGFVFRNRLRLRALYGAPPGHMAPPARPDAQPEAAPAPRLVERRRGAVIVKPPRRGA